MHAMFDHSRSLPDGTYVEAVRALYLTLTPSFIMAVAFLGIGAHVLLETPDALLMGLMAIAGAALLARLGVLILHRREASNEALDLARARRIELVFAVPYLAFALAFGAFSARAFQIASAESHMLVIGLLFGYAAGVAAGIYLRPWIALTSITLAVVPTSITALMSSDPTYVAAGTLLLLFLLGGIHSMMRNYRISTAEITSSRTYATLARADALTGLDNRLSLREAFDRAHARSDLGPVLAVHCLDLDRFKTVNDIHGHPVGDALLQAVSDRLRAILRQGDVAARVGGDEFVLLQVGAQHSGEADLLAHRIARVIGEPYAVMGHHLSIGTSVGYALYPDHGRDLDELIERADEALIRVKRSGGGIARFGADVSYGKPRLSA